VNTVTAGRKLVIDCLSSVLRLTRDEKKQYLVDKFRTFQVKVTPKQKFKYSLCVGEGENMHFVCRRGFALVYSVSHWYVEDIISQLKKGDVNVLRDFTKTNIVLVTDKRVQKFAERYDISVTPEQLASLNIATCPKSLMCAAWMKYYFALVGDQVPNTDSEIHLEPIPKKRNLQN
jgi:hypothetical protein